MSGFTFEGTGAGSNTPNKPLFGAGSTAGGTTPSLFGGGGTNNNANAGSSTPGTTSIFGSGNTGSSTLFGAKPSSSTPASGAPSLFGNNQATSGASQPSTSMFSFGGGAAGGGSNSSTPKPSIFGGGASGATTNSTPAVSLGGTASTSGPSTTPATTKTFTLSSTTPAGPPPGGSLFGGQANQGGTGSQQTSSSLFAPKPASTSTSSSSNLFAPTGSSSTPAKPLGSTPGSGAGLFSFNKDASADANKSTPTQQSTTTPGLKLFGAGNPPGSSGTQGTQATPKPSTPSLFNLGSTTPASSTPASKPPTFSLGTTPASTQPASSQPATTNAATTSGPSASNMFGGAGASSGASGSSSSNLFNFPKPGATLASSAAPSGATTTAASSGIATTTTAAPSLFSGLGKSTTTTSTQPSTSTTTTAPPTMAAGTSGTATDNKASGGDATKAPAAGLGSSIVGPAPSNQSRLKNKSMDEIITRWAADLSKYQKEYQQQAEQVAAWDRALVENTEKVSKLFSKTFQAERDASEVERQLRIMEEGQDELATWLDRYEKEVEVLMRGTGVQGRTDGLRGPDQERERTYKLAEKLQDRLNELNKDLTEMIEEINNVGQTLSKTGKPDDPLTKVVRVLNSQLSQLQLIDSGTIQLQEKIKAAQREGQRIGANGWNGLGTDPTEDFYRSFRGGRGERFGGVS